MKPPSWDQIIALCIVCGCLALLFTGINGEVKSILAVAAIWLFRGLYPINRGGTKPDAKG